MEKEKCKFCFRLCEILTSVINIQFKEGMKNEDFLLAAISHPKFKVNWIKDKERKRNIGAC